MKTILTLCIAMLLFIQTPLRAQVTEATPEEEPTVTPDVMPSFKGGDHQNFLLWFVDQIAYPKKALKNKISGKVDVSFIIEKDGQLTNIEILESTNELFNDETVRILKKSPRWTPGKVNGGGAVRVLIAVPVTFIHPDESKFLSTEGKKVDVMPKFQGGDIKKFSKWVMSRIVAPNQASLINSMAGDVTVAFIINEAGSLTDITVIHSTSKDFEAEVLRVLRTSPQWTPAYIDNKPVKLRTILPLTYKILSDDARSRQASPYSTNF